MSDIPTPLRVLDLFSGIGGFSLGLERTGGFSTVAFCEIEPFCRRVLAKHWPEVPCYDDVRTLTAGCLRADGIAVDVICGGFPCQDISVAGKQIGIGGERSGLWSEIARLAGELRPLLIVVENVAALLGNGLDRVLGDLAALGYDAEWHCIPAAALGAPHVRDRFWLIAYPAETSGVQHERQCDEVWGRKHPAGDGTFGHVADTHGQSLRDEGCAEAAQPSREGEGCGAEWQRLWTDVAASGSSADVADASRERCREAGQHRQRQAQRATSGGSVLADADQARFPNRLAGRLRAELTLSPSDRWWGPEPDVGRVADGVPNRVDRLRALGNAVVPQIPELIGNAILASLASAGEVRRTETAGLKGGQP